MAKSYLVCGTFVLGFAVVAGLLWADSIPADRGSTTYVADFALYDPPQADEWDGVWAEEVTALKAMFKAYGWSYKSITAQNLNSGYLGSGSNRKFRALIEPGGWAWNRNVAVSANGESSIRSFIQNGGNYVGFCAGAYYAAKTVTFDQYGTGYQSYPYDLKLLDGTAKGPFGWLPWNDGTNANLDLASINTGNATMKTIKIPASTHFFYAGGPWFTNIPSSVKYEVWARAKKPQGTPSSQSDGDSQPTVIRITYGKGSVILFAYHPEVLIDSMVDNVKLKKYYNEDTIDWNTGNQTQEQINIQSWNIVHAALQVASGQKVTAITKLPGN